ncbi:MAG: FAD-dependent oxidoreductase [Acidobacteria bacterium]|nr:FAD-dependent oxidoreductase [Acidobacteriota bacterium]
MTVKGEADIIIVGAGVAGLAAACDLAQAGLAVHIVEARNRIGGRVFTQSEALTKTPIELGAEFIHGSPPEILDLLRALQVKPVATSGDDWCEQDGQLSECDLFSDVDSLLEKMDDREPDQSFLDFLRRFGRAASEDTRQRARRYITGFHAADPALISVHSLVRSIRADAKIQAEHAFRIQGGYAVLLESFQNQLKQTGVPIQLNTPLERLQWKRNQVVLDCNSEGGRKTYCARQALLSLPLGVLQTRGDQVGAVRFAPDLPATKKKALNNLAMGKVMRLTLRFKERFWEHLHPSGAKTLAEMRFLFSRQEPFPTWWTQMPNRQPIITGWAPSHCAEALSGKGATVVLSSACQVLGELLKLAPPHIEQLVESAAFHDWQHDPFARGAYSYVKVGGDSAQQDLAAPIENTVFFAGEATDFSGYHGTVHGAIRSGHRAAGEILAVRTQNRPRSIS